MSSTLEEVTLLSRWSLVLMIRMIMVVMVDQDDYGNRGGHGLADHDYCGGHGPDNDHDIVVVLI